MDRGLWMSAAVGFLAPVVMFSPLNKADAWVTSWLDQHRPAAQAPASPPIVTVRQSVPARAAKGQRARSHRASEPIEVAAKPIDPKEQLARTIDPSLRPDWYLIDTTLKRGDILFLKDKVVVFRGRKIGNLADYVPVSRTHMLSGKERRLIQKLASAPQPSLGAAPEAVGRNRLAIATRAPSRVN